MPTTTMTAQWVERAKSTTGAREEWFDSKVTGLGLRISPAGKKVWFVMYRVKGQTLKRRITLDPFPAMTLADAREKAHEIILAAARGDDPAGKKVEEKRAPTFEDVAKEYIVRYAKGPGPEPRKRTWQRDEAMLKKEILPYWCHRKAHEITRRDVIELLDRLQDRGLTTQVNRIFALIRKVFNWAISRDIVQINPCNQVKAPAKENQRDKVLTEAEIRTVWQAFDQLSPLMKGAFKLLLLTAQRRNEVLSMRWCDLDLANGWWTIPNEQSKNKLSHRVPLSSAAIAIIQELRQVEDHEVWVFPSPRRVTGKHIESVQKSVDQIRDAHGLDFVLHDLRRTAASHMTSIGVSRLVVSKILNHVEQGITRVYDRHSYDIEKREAMDKWAQRLDSMLSIQFS